MERSEKIDLRNRVRFYLRLQRFEAAEKLLKSLIFDDPSNAYWINMLGMAFHQQGMLSEALDQFAKALQVNEGYVEAALNLAATQADISQYENAKNSYKRAVSAVDDKSFVPDLLIGRLADQHVASAQCYEKLGKTNEAKSEYEKALKLYPRVQDARLFLAKILISERNWIQARQQLETLLDLYTDHSEAKVLLGIVLKEIGRPDSATSLWKGVTISNPENRCAKILLEANS